MTDLDDGLRRDLETLAGQMPVTDLADRSVRRGRELRARRRTIAAAAGIAIIVAAVVVPITLVGHAARSGPPTIPPTGATKPPASSRLGSHDANWRVTGQIALDPSGPGNGPQPACKPSAVRVSAVTRQVTGGVAGLVTFRGHACSILATDGAFGLVDAQGNRLDVPAVANRAQSHPGINPFAYLSLGDGHAAVGFLWTGSWCGAQAVAVTVPTTRSFDASTPGPPIVVPLRGSQPACHGASDSTLRVGSYGGPTDAVLPAPASWRGLRLDLHLASVTRAHPLLGLAVQFSNSTGQPISLDPCPEYSIAIGSETSEPSGGLASSFDVGGLDCAGPVRVVPAHGDITVPIPRVRLDPDDTPKPGSTVTVTIGIAGIPTATATATVPS